MKKTKVSYGQSRIVVEGGTNTYSVSYQDILCFQSENGSIAVCLENGQKKYLESSLTELSNHLPEIFCLCSRTLITNLLHTKELVDKAGETFLLLCNGMSLAFSRRKYKVVKERFVQVKIEYDCFG